MRHDQHQNSMIKQLPPERLRGVAGDLLIYGVLEDLLAVDFLLDSAARDQTVDDDRTPLPNTIRPVVSKHNTDT